MKRTRRARWLWLGATACLLGASGGVPVNSAPGGFIDPEQIDRAAALFTGVEMGLPGGARARADDRLRLAHCSRALYVDWHGTGRRNLQVSCRDRPGWRVFVPLVAQAGGQIMSKAVQRGDQLTVIARGRGFAMQHPAQALGQGARGDWISVKLASGSKPVKARILGPSLVEIPLTERRGQ